MKESSETRITIKRSSERESSSRSTVTNGAGLISSIFYGILVVNLAVVFTASHYIDSAGPLELSDYYLNVLYVVSILWWISFGVSVQWGCNRADAKDPVKSHHASNRWLKGVVAVFAFTITLKDALELIALTEITNPLCTHKMLYVLMPILHTPYIFGQVIFLFLYSKHYLQKCQLLARFGIMHIMATNLSVWIATVANEAIEASSFDDSDLVVETFESMATLPPNDTLKEIIKPKSSSHSGLFHGHCTCTTNYCTRVTEAEKFLYPFLIEFCLISTCLLYVSWQKVGQKSKEDIDIIKPSHKFYKTYKGPAVGALVLAATVTVIIVLGSFDANTGSKSSSTEYMYLYLYETFLMICELFNFMACALGFYLYKISEKQQRMSVGISLDIVLLFVCLVGPLLIGLFSILSLCAGDPDSKVPHWWISLAYPIVDITAITFQITFVIYGMQHIPSTTVTVISTNDHKNEGCGSDGENRLQESADYQEVMELENSSTTGDTSPDVNRNRSFPKLTSDDNLRRKSISSSLSISSSRIATLKVQEGEKQKLNSVKISKIRLAAPNRVRIALRDVIMFLVISNASMWLFLSLDNTVFSTLSYQYNYFGHSMWITLTAVTTPLSIFFRMHSAACLFEMWSYA